MVRKFWILPSFLAAFAVLPRSIAPVHVSAAAAAQQAGTLVLVFKDGREQPFSMTDIARIEFRGATPSTAPAPTVVPAPSNVATLAGNWTAIWEAKGLHQGGYRITQNGNRLTFIAPDGSTSTGTFKDNATVVAEQWKGSGTIKNNGKTIMWDNGSHWER